MLKLQRKYLINPEKEECFQRTVRKQLINNNESFSVWYKYNIVQYYGFSLQIIVRCFNKLLTSRIMDRRDPLIESFRLLTIMTLNKLVRAIGVIYDLENVNPCNFQFID